MTDYSYMLLPIEEWPEPIWYPINPYITEDVSSNTKDR